jgi:hypothetical protein
MTPDGQLLSADSFQLLMSDGSSSSSSCLLQAEDIQALLSSSSPTAVGNSPPGPPRSAVDHRHLGLNTATGPPEPTAKKRVEMASLGLPETAEHRHLSVSSSGVTQSADNRRLVVTSSTMPNTVDHQRFESHACAGGPLPAGTVPVSPPRKPPGHVMFGETITRSGGTGSAHQTGVDHPLKAHESPSNILLPNGELSPVGGRTDPAGGKINPAQYFVTKCGTTAATGSRRVHKSVAKNNNYSSSSSSSCPPTATTMQTAVTTAVPEVASPPKVIVTRNMIAGRPISGGGGSAAKAPALPPEIVFPREPLLPAEIQGFVSGLGYSAGDLPPFAASATPPPAVVLPPPATATGGKVSARSTPVSSNKASNNKSRSRTKENMKVPAAV